MRLFKLLIVSLFFISCLTAPNGKAGVDIGLSIGDDGIKGFYLAIGEYYKVPEKKIVVIKKKKIADEDIPVVFFLAQRSGVKPGIIIDLRLGGRTWMEITGHFGLTAEIFYVPITVASGPPYGKAYGHYKNTRRKKWKTIKLTDVEIADFVNLRFLSDHYGYSPDEIVKMRQQGKSFIVINDQVKKIKKEKKSKAEQLAAKEKSKSKGKKKK